LRNLAINWQMTSVVRRAFSSEVSALELRRHPGVWCKTAWLVGHKLKEVVRVREKPRRRIRAFRDS
jgi:hypothetical protein